MKEDQEVNSIYPVVELPYHKLIKAVTVEDTIYKLASEIEKINTKLDEQIKTRDALLYLNVERMKQLEAAHKAIHQQYKLLAGFFSKFANNASDLSVLVSKTVDSIELINGYTGSEINSMTSDEYFEKILKPLGIRDSREKS